MEMILKLINSLNQFYFLFWQRYILSINYTIFDRKEFLLNKALHLIEYLNVSSKIPRR